MRRFFGPTGFVSRIAVESRAVENNLLGDPAVRVVWWLGDGAVRPARARAERSS